jgi:methionine-rich copper-binding protein CopC
MRLRDFSIDEDLAARIAALSAFILVALIVLGLGQPAKAHAHVKSQSASTGSCMTMMCSTGT